MGKIYVNVNEYNSNIDKFIEVDTNEVKSLADFASGLIPEEGLSGAFGYIGALYIYFKNQNSCDKELYDILTSSIIGKSFLCVNISMSLLEKKINANIATPAEITEYNELQGLYYQIINMSIELHNQNVFCKKIS